MADKNTKKSVIDAETWAAYKRNDIPTEVNGLMRDAYLQYSVSANIGRAIPDVRDGLKPGARRILYAMLRGHFGSAGGTNKCAKVVGKVIGDYHPHGDTAVYDTIVRMAQDFSMRVPLIFGKGNFGTMDGDGAAAYRYTECKMEKSAEMLLQDLDMDTVDMRDTFDAKDLEPIVLPAAFPNLLVNGSQGIGVGMATNIPPHNPQETIDAAIALIDNPNITVDQLMEIIPGPDYPTGGVIHGTAGIRKLYETGQGTLRVRGKVEVETSKDGRDSIIISEIPYGINKAEMVARIGEMARENIVHGITSVNDYSSDRVGVRIVIELKHDATTSVVINELYKTTPLESTDSGQLLVIDHNRPRTMNLKQILEAYVDHREEVIRRRTQFELDKAVARAHIVDGLLVAQGNIDEIIRIIRGAEDTNDAKREMMTRFPLDDVQCDAILAMRLSQLTHLGVDELQKEKETLTQEIERLRTILSTRANIMAVVRQELVQARDSKALISPRRTRIEDSDGEVNLDGLTKREIYVITLTRQGYIKRCSTDEYAAQNRGGSGVKGMTARKEGDTVHMAITSRSHNSLLFITNHGRIYRMARAYEIPESKRADGGRFISNVLNLFNDPEHPENHEEIRAIISYDEKSIDLDNNFIVMITKHGIIKRCRLSLFKNIRKIGKRALTFREDDDLIDAQLTDGTKDILITSRNGRAVRFEESQVRPMGTTASGVMAIRLKPEADGTPGIVVSMAIVSPEEELLTITANGFGKRTPVGTGAVSEASEEESTDEAEAENAPERSAFHYRRTNRGTQGCAAIKLRDGDFVVAALKVPPECDQDILLLSKLGQAVRTPVEQIRLCGRNTQGVIVMRFAKENDTVANVSLLSELSEEDAAANAAEEAQANATEEVQGNTAENHDEQ